MTTLTVIRKWTSAYSQVSTLLDEEGKTVEIITSSIKQPKKNSKTITLTKKGKQTTYLLDWSQVTKRYQYE